MICCDFATDVYSFGMLMWSLITGKLAYKGFKPVDMVKMIYNGDRLKINNREWQLWAKAYIDVNSLKKLLDICWAQYPQDRPTFFQIDAVLVKMLQFGWHIERILWIGYYKNNDNGLCMIKLLPKEIVKYLLDFVR